MRLSQVNSKLRRTTGRYMHWCPGCEEMHQLPDSWTFDGNLDRPTFNPSFKHSRPAFPSYTAEGIGLGESFTKICHYHLHDGVLKFCNDSMHPLAGQNVPLPDLPAHLRDGAVEEF